MDLDRIREYDSVASILKTCSSKAKSSWLSAFHNSLPHLSCFAACPEFLLFGWDTGYLTLFDRCHLRKWYLKIEARNRSLFPNLTTINVPLNISICLHEDLIITCSCRVVHNSGTRLSIASAVVEDSDRTWIHVYRIPTTYIQSSFYKKLKHFLVPDLHRCSLTCTPLVTPAADWILTGDARGLLVATQFSQQTQSYRPQVLTVIPGSVLDVQLQGSFLLITGRCFPEGRFDQDESFVNIVGGSCLIYFLFNIPTRTLHPIDLNSMLPKSLDAKVNCIRPIWMPKSSPNYHRFMCTVACRTEQTEENLLPIAAMFHVNGNNQAVSFFQVIYLHATLNNPPRIPVLPSVVSTSAKQQQSPQGATDFVNHICIGLQSLHMLSSTTILLWSTPKLDKEQDPTQPPRSSLAVFRLHMDYPCLPSPSRFIKEANQPVTPFVQLLTHSDQLGLITNVSGVWLKPHVGPVPTRQFSPPHNYAGGQGGLGLELWIQRRAPCAQMEKNTMPLILLSTRPLCTSHIVWSSSVDLDSLFTDPAVIQPDSVRSSLSLTQINSHPPASVHQKSSLPCLSQTTITNHAQDGLELGVEVLNDQSIIDIESSRLGDTRMQTSTPEDTSILHDNHPDPASLTGVSPETIGVDEPLQSFDQPEAIPIANQWTPQPHQLDQPCANGIFEPELPTDHDVMTKSSSPPPMCESDPLTVQPDSNHTLDEAADQEIYLSASKNFLVEDNWDVFTPTSYLREQSEVNSRLLEYAIADGAECVPFVHSHGCAGIFVCQPHDKTSSSFTQCIFAPNEFGCIHSLHISPNGKLIWCLRRSDSSSIHTGFDVDMCVEPHGLNGLLSAWLSGHMGQWETRVLLHVTSLDLLDTFAISSTSSGFVKLHMNSSVHRQCNQSYTWPCPDYHILQVAVSPSGVVWALAITKSDQFSHQQFDLSTAEVCLITASLPIGSLPTTPPLISKQLRGSLWYPIALPLMLRSLSVHQLTRQAQSLSAFTESLNAHFKITLNPQTSGAKSGHLSAVGWLLVQSPPFDPSRADVHGSVFFLPNLKPLYKPNDLDWCQISIDGSFPRVYSKISKRTQIGSLVSKHFPTRVVVTTNTSSSANTPMDDGSVVCSYPFWITTQGAHATILGRARRCLTVYQWFTRRVLSSQSIRSGSPLLDNSLVHCQYVWRFPRLIHSPTHGPMGSDNTPSPSACTLWTLNALSNELFCHVDSTYSRSLALPPSPAIIDVVSAVCVVPDDTNADLFHLLVATCSGKLWSRIGICPFAVTGTSWVREPCPAHWPNDGTSSNLPPSYFTSLHCVGKQLLATDSLGHICSSTIELTQSVSGTSRLLSPSPSSWCIRDSSSQSGIFFLSISGAQWESFGLSLWAVGLELSSHNADKISRSLCQPFSADHSSHLGFEPIPGHVFAHCWNPDDQSLFWRKVPSPLTTIISVRNRVVWILSKRLYVRQGLTDRCANSVNSNNYPAPTEKDIGRSWQMVAALNPITPPNHPMLDSFTLVPELSNVAEDLVGISPTGDLYELKSKPPILFR